MGIAMGKLNVKNGTPVGNEHLCKSCTWGQIITGYRESDVMALCTNTNPNFRLPFTVHECTEFQDKSRPDWEQMEKLAIQIEPVRISKKTRGFNLPDPLVSDPPEHEPAIAAEDEELEEVSAIASTVLTSDW
jgi:hypothetical protein